MLTKNQILDVIKKVLAAYKTSILDKQYATIQYVDDTVNNMPDSSNFLNKVVDKNVHYESSDLTYGNPDLLDDYYQLNNFGSYVFNKTWDLKMSSNSTLEPYYIDLIKDGKVQFTLTPDKFSFNEAHLYYEADTVIRDGIHYKIYASARTRM